MAEGTCSIEGCEKPNYCRTWCRAHYAAWTRHDDPEYQRPKRVCSIDGCEEPHFGKGWCAKHYQSWYTHDDPLWERTLLDRRCAAEGCDRPHDLHGYCSMHWQRLLARGTTDARVPTPLVERFWARVNKDGPTMRPDLTPCWVWTGGTKPNKYDDASGYGAFWIGDGRYALAHKWLWEHVNGPVPDGYELCHACDNPPCVRHVSLCTHDENMKEMMWRERAVWRPHGTMAGWKRHYIRGEEPCAPCLAANREYQREWARAKRQRDAT